MKRINLKKKIQNYIHKKGEKELSEKLLFKSIKLTQKASYKNFIDILKLAIINLAPIMQVKQLKRKRKRLKEFPFIPSKRIRLFSAVTLIIKNAKLKSTKFSIALSKDFVTYSAKASESLKTNQEYALKLKKYVHYRWLS